MLFTPECLSKARVRTKSRKIGEKNQMRFKFQRGGTALIRNMLRGFGFGECSETSMDYNVLWLNSHVKPFSLRNMMEFQRVNHFPRSFELTRKASKGLRILIEYIYIICSVFNKLQKMYICSIRIKPLKPSKKGSTLSQCRATSPVKKCSFI